MSSSTGNPAQSLTVSQPGEQEKRVCQIIKLKPEYVDQYKALHAPGGTWPGVLAALERHHITQYSIHYYPPLQLLIAQFVYTGNDWDVDTAGIAADPETQRWWKVTDAMQESFTPEATGSAGELPWWTDLERVFWFDGKNAQSK